MKIPFWVFLVIIGLLAGWGIYEKIKLDRAGGSLSAVNKDLSDLRTADNVKFAADAKRYSDLQTQLGDSQGTVSSLTGSLAASRAEDLDYQRRLAEITATAVAAQHELDSILNGAIDSGGDFDKAIGGLESYGERAAEELGIRSQGLPSPLGQNGQGP